MEEMTYGLMILNSGLNLAAAVFLYRLTACFLIMDQRKWAKVLAVLGCWVVCGMVFFVADPVNIIGTLILYCGIVFLFARGSLLSKAAVVIMLFPMVAVLSYVQFNNPIYDALLYAHEIQGGRIQYSTEMYLYQLCCGALKVFFWYIVYRIFRTRETEMKRYVTDTVWRHVLIVGIASFLSVLTAIIFPPSYHLYGPMRSSPEENQILEGIFYAGSYVLLVAAMVTNFGILFMLSPLIENMKMRMETQNVRVREEYYRTLEESQTKLRKIRHDMNNHMQVLDSYLKTGDSQGAADYLEQYLQENAVTGVRRFCGNHVVNALLNSRYDRMEENGIDIHFHIDINDQAGITPVDLCTIFSNALDNALESCLKTAEDKRRFIELRARQEKGMFSLQVRNSRQEPLLKHNGRILSDKKKRRGGEEEGHGYGLDNIRDVVDKYRGKMELSHEEGEFGLFLYLPCL